MHRFPLVYVWIRLETCAASATQRRGCTPFIHNAVLRDIEHDALCFFQEQLVSNAFKAAAAGTAGNKSDDGGGNVKKRMRGSESDVAVAATAATAGTSVGAAPNAPPGVPPQLSQPPNQPQLLLPHMLPMSVLPVALQPPSLSSTLLPHQLSMGLQPRPITPTVSPQQLMQQLGVAVQQQAQPQVQQTPPQAASPTMPAPPVRKQQLQEQQERLRQLQQQQQQQQHMLEQQLAQAQAQQLQLQLLLQARAQQEGSVGQEPLQNVGQPLAILPPPAVSALTGIHILDLSQAPQPAPSAASPSQGQAPDQPANTALLSKLEHLAQQWQPQPQQAQAGDQAHRQEGEQMQRQAGEQEQEPEGEQARGQGGEQQGGPSPDGAAQVDAMEMHLPNFRRFSRNSLTISLPPLSPSLMDLFGDLDDSAGVDMVQAVHQLAQHTQLQLLQQAQIDQQGVPEAAQGQLAQQQAPQGPSPQPAHQQLQPSPSPDGHQGQQATSAHTPSLGNHHQGSQATAELVSGQDGCAAAANTGASPGLQQLTSPVLGVVRDRSPQRMKRVASAMSATSTDVPPEAQTQPLSRDFQGASQPGSVCAQGEDATMAMPGRSPQGGTTQPSHDAPEQLSQQQQQVRSHAGGHSGALQAQTEGPAPLQSSQLSLQHLLHASQAGGEQRGYPRPATPQAQAQAQQTQSQGVPSTWQGLAPVGVTLNADLAQRMESMVAATPPTTELGVWGGQEPQQPQQQQQLHHPQPQQLLHQLPGNFVGAVGPGLGTSFAELLGQRSLQPNITPPSDRVTNAMSILRMGSAPPLCALPPLPMISAPMPSAAPVGHSAHHPMSRASPALSIHRTASPQLPMPQQPPCPMPALGLPPGSMHLPPANMPSPAQLLSDARAALQGVDSRVMHQLGTDIQQGTGASGGAPNSGHGAAPPLGPGSSLVLALAAQMEDMQRLQAQQAQQAEQQLRQLEHLRQALMSHVGTNSGSKSSS